MLVRKQPAFRAQTNSLDYWAEMQHR